MPNSMKCLRLLTLLYVGALHTLLADQSDLHCIEDMEVPQKHAAAAYTSGTVEASVIIGSDGKPELVKLQSGSKLLRNEVEFYLKYRTRYSTTCKGQQVSLYFTYAIEGELAEELSSTVHFLPPNRFVIVSRPVRPVADPVRKKKEP